MLEINRFDCQLWTNPIVSDYQELYVFVVIGAASDNFFEVTLNFFVIDGFHAIVWGLVDFGEDFVVLTSA